MPQYGVNRNGNKNGKGKENLEKLPKNMCVNDVMIKRHLSEI